MKALGGTLLPSKFIGSGGLTPEKPQRLFFLPYEVENECGNLAVAMVNQQALDEAINWGRELD